MLQDLKTSQTHSHKCRVLKDLKTSQTHPHKCGVLQDLKTSQTHPQKARSAEFCKILRRHKRKREEQEAVEHEVFGKTRDAVECFSGQNRTQSRILHLFYDKEFNNFAAHLLKFQTKLFSIFPRSKSGVSRALFSDNARQNKPIQLQLVVYENYL